MKIDPFDLFFDKDASGKFKKDANGRMIPLPIKTLIFAPTSAVRENLLGNISVRNSKGTKVLLSETKDDGITIVSRKEGRFQTQNVSSIEEVVQYLNERD